jgi:hypothetical protein
MNSIIKEKQRCQALTKKNVQCKNKCEGDFCWIHDPKECEKRRFNRELLDREYAYIKYVLREIKKEHTRYRKYLERQQHKKQCKAVTAKGLPCKITPRSEYCHIHAYLVVDKPLAVESPLVPKEEPAEESSSSEEESAPSEDEEEQCYEIRALVKEIMNKCNDVPLRSYSGVKLDPFIQRRIDQFYKQEQEGALSMYKGMLNMLRCYTSLDEIDPDGVRKEIKMSLSMLRKSTDDNVKYMMKRKR